MSEVKSRDQLMDDLAEVTDDLTDRRHFLDMKPDATDEDLEELRKFGDVSKLLDVANSII